MAITRRCLNCGKDFSVYPSELKKSKGSGQYCKRDCWLDAIKKEPIKTKCKACGGMFDAKPSEVARGGGIYCKPSCAYSDRLGDKHARYIPKKQGICHQCGTDYPIPLGREESSRFCGNRCRAKWLKVNAPKGADNPNWKGGNKKNTCQNCGKVFDVYPGSEQACCNQKCAGELKVKTKKMAGENCPRWRGGISFEPYSPDWTARLKDRIRQQQDHACLVCGLTSLENGRKLDVHHIDYNKKNCDELNLVALCRSCHTRTNSDREEWQEYFSHNKTPSKVLSAI